MYVCLLVASYVIFLIFSGTLTHAYAHLHLLQIYNLLHLLHLVHVKKFHTYKNNN